MKRVDWTRYLDHYLPDDHNKREKSGNTPPPPTSRKTIEKAPIEERLDLHGLTRDEADTLLRQFVRSCVQAGMKKVLIIHGKGLHSEERKSVLKDYVIALLRKLPEVKKFGDAEREEGGSGASWVWLNLG